jgi:hypothetical protein
MARKSPVSITGELAEIENEHLWNTNMEPYRYTNLLAIFVIINVIIIDVVVVTSSEQTPLHLP